MACYCWAVVAALLLNVTMAIDQTLPSTVLFRGELPLPSPQAGEGQVVLVSYAHGEVYSNSQIRLRETAKSSVHYFLAWSHASVQAHFPHLAHVWDLSRYPTRNNRHLCMSVKSIIMQHSFNHSSSPFDWIIYIDSSQYFRDGVNARFDTFVSNLATHNLDAYPGTALCGLINIDQGGLVTRETFQALGADRPHYWFAPHFQSNFFAFRTGFASTRLFLQEWVDYSLDPRVSCSSPVDDQAPFSVLVAKYKLPFINFCKAQNFPDFQDLKNVTYILTTTSSLSSLSSSLSQASNASPSSAAAVAAAAAAAAAAASSSAAAAASKAEHEYLRVVRDSDAFLASLQLDWDAECVVKGRKWRRNPGGLS